MPENRTKTGLTANSVKAAKPKDRPYKHSECDGLYLLVQPNGNRFWRMNYRFHGKQKTMSFGRWPEVMLADARKKLLAARRLLADKIDPMEQAKLDAIHASMAQAHRFKVISDEWLEKARLEKRAPITIKKYEWQLSLVMPTLGNRPITAISAHEVLLALKRIEKTKKYYTACSVGQIPDCPGWLRLLSRSRRDGLE